MPGAYTYIYTDILTYKLTLHPWPRIMNSAEKKVSQMDPAHGPPLQARVAAANRTVLAACKHVGIFVDPGAHGMEQGQTKQMNGGKATERGQER